MADARRLSPDFDITRSWELPDVPVLPGDEDLDSYLLRLGFNDVQLGYVRRAYANATGEAPRNISAMSALEDMEILGSGDYRVLDGYDCVFAGLADGVDIRLQTIVTSVEWSGDSVRVETADGQRFEAEQVVIALPLGVLQSGKVCFTPELPTEKQSAIANLRMGPVIKLVYRFDETILPAGVMAIHGANNPPMWWSPSFGHPSHDAGKQVFTAFASGDWARELLALGEAGALEKGVRSLETDLNRKLQPNASQLVNWPEDPFALGGYSVATPGHAGARAELARPLANRLYWAGEATAPNRIAATVHGAYESGRRAASEILSIANR
jgi:monoamine oxidase